MLNTLTTERAIQIRELDTLTTTLAAQEQELIDLTKAHKILLAAAAELQDKTHTHVSTVVRRCLQFVFGPSYEFTFRFEIKRGKTEAVTVFTKDDEEFLPMLEEGGAIVDVASFALRLAALLISRPAPQRVLILDEPFKFVSEDYRDQVRDMLTTLADEYEVQIIMVTHIPELIAGDVVMVGE